MSSIGSASSLKELAHYIRTKRDSHLFIATPNSPGPISPRSSVAVSYSDKYKRLSVVSGVSGVSGVSSMSSMSSFTSKQQPLQVKHDNTDATQLSIY